GDGDREGGGGGVVAAVRGAAGVVGGDGDGGAAVRVRGGRVGEDAGGVDGGLGAEEGVVVVRRRERDGLRCFVRRPGGDRRGPGCALRACVLEHRAVAAGGEGRCVVDGGDGDREGGGGGVLAAVRGAAGVAGGDGDGGVAVRVRGGRVGEDAGGVDGGLGAEEGVVVVRRRERDGLRCFVRRPGGDRRGPGCALRACVLEHRAGAAGGEGRCVVDGDDGDREGGGGGVLAAVRGAAGVAGGDGDGGVAVRVRGGRVGEDAGGVDGGLGAEEGVVVVRRRERDGLRCFVRRPGGDRRGP